MAHNKICATQEMLRINVTGPGEESPPVVETITQADLISMCAEGPLKALFTSPLTQPPPGPGAPNWLSLLQDARLTVLLTAFGSLFPGACYNFTGVSPTGNLVISVSSPGNVIVELRFNNSLIR